jgi:hypothetical protein
MAIAKMKSWHPHDLGMTQIYSNLIIFYLIESVLFMVFGLFRGSVVLSHPHLPSQWALQLFVATGINASRVEPLDLEYHTALMRGRVARAKPAKAKS